MRTYNLQRLLSAIEDRRVFGALLTWPKFSLASFLITSRLSRFGIRPRTVIDLGANVGQFAVAAAKLLGNPWVHSFEPDPAVCKILRENVSTIPNVTVYEMAIGEHAGEAEFNVNKDSQVSSLLPLGAARLEAFPASTVARAIRVRVETLGDLFGDKPIEGPVLLKLDVQGYEDRVLRGGKDFLKRVDFILVEASFKPLYEGEADFSDLVTLLSGLGFRARQPLNWHVSPKDGSIIETDMLFTRA